MPRAPAARREATPAARAARALVVVGALAVLGGCADGGGPDGEPAWTWPLRSGWPEPVVPDDNPMTPAKVALGRRLFYDVRLSGNETQSCGSCHEQARAFTDGRAQAEGSTGEAHPRGAMTIANVAYATTLGWANQTLRTLEAQALVPLFGQHPVELGLAGLEDEVVARFADTPDDVERFRAAFPDADDVPTLAQIVDAIASFERRVLSFDAPYDRFWYDGDNDALSDDAKAGMALFMGERFECFHCHGGFTFTDASTHEETPFEVIPFHNNGLYNLDGEGAYPADNQGLIEQTGEPFDMGRFKAPTLRNIALTAPYMHDGSIATLDEVLDHYARGGRKIDDGPAAGDGRDSPVKSGLVAGFNATSAEKAQVRAFLEALTDDALLADPALADPFAAVGDTP